MVGAEDNSPKAVHHRAASGTYDSQDTNAKPSWDIFTLYGALAGGPGADDSYKDSRSNYQMNEVALDYNAGFTLCLAALVHFGLGTKDGALNFDRAWPPKHPTYDITVKIDGNNLKISTGSGMLCSSWCVSFKTDSEIKGCYDCNIILSENPNYTFCNKRETNFLDGEGTEQKFGLQVSEGFVAPTEFEVLCDGFHAVAGNGDPMYIPEYGHSYKVTSPGGPSNTKPLFEESECWPSHVC